MYVGSIIRQIYARISRKLGEKTKETGSGGKRR